MSPGPQLRSGGVEMEEKGERYRDGDKVRMYLWDKDGDADSRP